MTTTVRFQGEFKIVDRVEVNDINDPDNGCTGVVTAAYPAPYSGYKREKYTVKLDNFNTGFIYTRDFGFGFQKERKQRQKVSA